jgi:hypothetical protein
MAASAGAIAAAAAEAPAAIAAAGANGFAAIAGAGETGAPPPAGSLERDVACGFGIGAGGAGRVTTLRDGFARRALGRRGRDGRPTRLGGRRIASNGVATMPNRVFGKLLGRAPAPSGMHRPAARTQAINSIPRRIRVLRCWRQISGAQ